MMLSDVLKPELSPVSTYAAKLARAMKTGRSSSGSSYALSAAQYRIFCSSVVLPQAGAPRMHTRRNFSFSVSRIVEPSLLTSSSSLANSPAESSVPTIVFVSSELRSQQQA